MAGSANVSSTDAIQQFRSAVIAFQDEARTCLTALDHQLRQIMLWLEQDRPNFWKREIETCMREMTSARVRLHQCRMRRMGDFRPSCIEEVKDLEKAKQQLELAQKQLPLIRRWHAEASHEANEFRGRASQVTQAVERDLPSLLALLAFSLQKLEEYAAVTVPTPNSSAASIIAVHDADRTARHSLPDQQSVDGASRDSATPTSTGDANQNQPVT